VAQRVLPPWSTAGGPDLAYGDHFRRATHALLTDPALDRLFPGGRADYDDMIYALGLIWECPGDGGVNAVGFCCAHCGQPRDMTETPPERDTDYDPEADPDTDPPATGDAVEADEDRDQAEGE
jgi:hypothetical protein